MNDAMRILTELLSEHLGVDESEVQAETSFADDLGADSLDVAELAIAVEDRFGITLEDAELDRVRTVGQAAVLLESKLRELGTPGYRRDEVFHDRL
jgi:acyl carrier protein